MHVVEADQPVVGVLEQRAGIEHDDLAHQRQAARRAQRLVDELLVFRQEERRFAVLELILDLADRAGGVDAVADGAAAHRRHVGDEELAAGVGHRGDAVAGLQAERIEAGEEIGDRFAVGRPGDLLVEAHVLVAKRDAVRRGGTPRQEPLRDAP